LVFFPVNFNYWKDKEQQTRENYKLQPRSNLPPEPNVIRCPNPRCGALKDANIALCPHCGERYCPNGHLIKPYSRYCPVCRWEDRNFRPPTGPRIPTSKISEPDETKTHKVQYECPNCHSPLEENGKCNICGYLGSRYSGEFRDKKTFEKVPDNISTVPQQHLDSFAEQRTPLKEAESSQLRDVAQKDWISQSKVLVSETPSSPKRDKTKSRKDWGYKPEISSKFKLFLIFGIVAIVIIAGASVFWILNDNGNQPGTSTLPNSEPLNPPFAGVPSFVISNVLHTDITQSSAVITWVTDKPSTSKVEYGTNPDYGFEEVDENSVTNHSVKLIHLDPDTTYYYRVISVDESGNAVMSESGGTFMTEPLPDTVPPVIDEVEIADVSDSTAIITWVTDEEASSVVYYGKTPAYSTKFSPDDSLVAFHKVSLSKLEADKTYYFKLESVDERGNKAVFDAAQSFKTLSPIPTGPSVGKRAPDFTLYNLDGDQSVTLSELRGKIVMINFWAPGCGACVAEMPDIEAVYKAWSGTKELEVISIGGGYEMYVRNIVEEKGWTLPVFPNPDGSVFTAYQISTIPRTFFVDTKGIIRKIELGSFANQEQIVEVLNSLQ